MWIKEYLDTKPTQQCLKCWSLTHNTSTCTSPYKCRRCGDSDHEWDNTCNNCKITHIHCPHDTCTNCSKECPADSKLCSLRRVARGITSYPKPSLTEHPPTSRAGSIPTTCTHQNPNDHKISYLYNALPLETEFSQMTDKDAIECICMILLLSEEKVEQERHQLHTSHSCKGTSVHFLTPPILSHSPPVHMYSPFSPLYYLQEPYLKPMASRPDGPMTFQKSTHCKGNLTDLRRILYLSLAKGNPK
jgi:hypothetical protein